MLVLFMLAVPAELVVLWRRRRRRNAAYAAWLTGAGHELWLTTASRGSALR